jgi:hypothetical protein
MRSPEEEPLDLDSFLLQIMRLPNVAERLQSLPNPSQTVNAVIAGAARRTRARHNHDQYEPKGPNNIESVSER